MQVKAPLVSALAISLLSVGWAFSASLAQDGSTAVGRYQQTAVFRQEGLDRIYVTVLDTSTGEVVRLMRFDTGDYEKQ